MVTRGMTSNALVIAERNKRKTIKIYEFEKIDKHKL